MNWPYVHILINHFPIVLTVVGSATLLLALSLPPVWLRAVVSVLAAFGLSIVVRTAYLGGKIVHDSPKLANPPAAVR